jgi:hypothetical protein
MAEGGDAKTGDVLWKFKTPSGIIGNPMTYVGPDGKQYVAVLSGIGGWSGIGVAADMESRGSDQTRLGAIWRVQGSRELSAHPGGVLTDVRAAISRPIDVRLEVPVSSVCGLACPVVYYRVSPRPVPPKSRSLLKPQPPGEGEAKAGFSRVAPYPEKHALLRSQPEPRWPFEKHRSRHVIARDFGTTP